MIQVSIPKVSACVGVYRGVAIFFNGKCHAIGYGDTLSYFMYPEIEDAEEAIDICLMPDV